MASIYKVIVGRSEVLLPAFEEILVREYRRNKLAGFASDRYRKAYAEQVRMLGEATNTAR